ncbi:MAG TPA: Fe-S cluster assembly protein SufD [Saprospiraceae bacterium]|nr:Fe-S cluster assembly protein SufD [Saprospiraceae bacterium]
MITEVQDKNIARFGVLFSEFEEQLNGQKQVSAHNFRSKAAERLATLSFPTRRDEDYKYTSFARLLNQDYTFPVEAEISQEILDSIRIPGEEAIELVFVNGLFDESQSKLDHLPKGLTITTIEKALEDEATKGFAEKHLNENASTDNPFVVLNTTFAEGGVFIHVAKNAIIDRPIHFIQYNTATEQPFMFHPQRIVEVEQGGQLKIIDSFSAAEGAVYFANVVNVFHVHANAHVFHYKLQDESETAFQVNNTTAFQEKDSTYTNLALDLGGRIVRNNLNAIHQGENITSNLYGAFNINGDQHVDHQTFIDHAIPNCQSNELYKGVLDGKSNGVFNGKVMVRRDAQKTNAYQQNAALVLSDKATMDSKPQLEIYADDVKCSHGATIGQLDQASMFYLKSRGMSEKMAREALQHAFLIEVLEQINNEAIQQRAEAMLYHKFGK